MLEFLDEARKYGAYPVPTVKATAVAPTESLQFVFPTPVQVLADVVQHLTGGAGAAGLGVGEAVAHRREGRILRQLRRGL